MSNSAMLSAGKLAYEEAESQDENNDCQEEIEGRFLSWFENALCFVAKDQSGH